MLIIIFNLLKLIYELVCNNVIIILTMEGTEKGTNKIQLMLEKLRKKGEENNKENNDDDTSRQNKKIVQELKLNSNNEDKQCKNNEDNNINEVMIPNTFRTVNSEQNQINKKMNDDTPNKKSFKLFHSVFPKTQQNTSNNFFNKKLQELNERIGRNHCYKPKELTYTNKSKNITTKTSNTKLYEILSMIGPINRVKANTKPNHNVINIKNKINPTMIAKKTLEGIGLHIEQPKEFNVKEYIERRKKKENIFDRKYYNTQLNSLDEKLFGKEYMNNTDSYKLPFSLKMRLRKKNNF